MKKPTPTARRRGQPVSARPRRELPAVQANPERGLSSAQVRERQEKGWANTPVEAPTRTVGQIVKENVCTFFNLILYMCLPFYSIRMTANILNKCFFIWIIHSILSRTIHNSISIGFKFFPFLFHSF